MNEFYNDLSTLIGQVNFWVAKFAVMS